MKKIFAIVCMTAMVAACGEKKAEATTEANANATEATTEVAAEAEAPADAASIACFNPEDLKVEGVISEVKVGEVKGKDASVVYIPVKKSADSYKAFSTAVFNKIKAETGRVGNDMKEDITEPVLDADIFVYTYKVDGHDIYCTLSNCGGEKGSDYEIIFTKY
ncbi:MAG: hypothetical protein Q4D23_10950 [Bacteroidales bacterium]|nr:hypothetical protein [Bacteroidales bacterium]